MTDCELLKLDNATIQRVIHEQPDFAELFIAHLLVRNTRVEADLVDLLFNSSEKRLARLLLLMANFGTDGKAGKDKSSDARGNDRDHAVARKHVHEQIP